MGRRGHVGLLREDSPGEYVIAVVFCTRIHETHDRMRHSQEVHGANMHAEAEDFSSV